MDDRDQLVDGLSESGAEPDQPVPLLKRDQNTRRQFATQDLVLDLQVLDLAGQFFLGSARDQKQQLSVDVSDGRCGRKVLSSMGMISFLHTGMAATRGARGVSEEFRWLRRFISRVGG